MSDIVIISRHEKGFLQADLYRGGADFDSEDWVGAVPDAYMTGGVGQDSAEFHASVKETWPYADIRPGDEDAEQDDLPEPVSEAARATTEAKSE